MFLLMMDKLLTVGAEFPQELHEVLAETALHNQNQNAFCARIAKYLTGMGGRPRGPLKKKKRGSFVIERLKVSNGIQIPSGKFHELCLPP